MPGSELLFPVASECGWAQSEPDSGGTPDSGVACGYVVVVMS